MFFCVGKSQAALTYVGGTVSSRTGHASSALTFDLTALAGGFEASAREGDIVIVALAIGAVADKALSISTAGYTGNELTELYANDTYDANLAVYWKIMGSTPDITVTAMASGDTSAGIAVSVQVWRGVDQSNPIDVAIATATGLNDGKPIPPAILPTTVGAIIIPMGVASYSTSAIFTTATLSNFISGAQVETQDVMVGMGSYAWSSGTYTPAAFGGGITNTSASWAAATLALRPAQNYAPVINIDNPAIDTDVIDGSDYQIQYDLSDTEDTATVDFYFETDGNGAGGTAIASCQNQVEGTNATCLFTPSSEGMSLNTYYYIYGVASDGINGDVVDVSAGRIRINDAPTLSISEPNGTGDTVTVGDTYNITYTLTDTDNVVTSAFYYDSNASGLDGTAITGACVAAAEGSNVTCSWDTTGMPAGSYYVYGKTSDGMNPQVSAYSLGQITIQSPGSLSVDVVDSGGTSIASPSVSFSSKMFDWTTQSSTATLGISAQKIRVTNSTATATWTLSIAAQSGNTALWTNGGNTYDFNGTASAGRLQINGSVGTITPQGGCVATGISKGVATYFAQGTQDSITLLSASGSAQTGCYWDLTGVGMSQDIPASQATGTYTLNLTLTAT